MTQTLTGPQALRLEDVPGYADAYNRWKAAQAEADAARQASANLAGQQRAERNANDTPALRAKHKRQREQAHEKAVATARAADEAKRAFERAAGRATGVVAESYGPHYQAAYDRALAAAAEFLAAVDAVGEVMHDLRTAVSTTKVKPATPGPNPPPPATVDRLRHWVAEANRQ